MSKICLLILSCISCCVIGAYSQNDTLPDKTLEEVILSVNKWEQKMNEVPNKITKVTKAQILRYNPQTSADLLSQTGTVFVQKSQLGGGSPIIRGFATNRVLMVLDGVRMNNAIFRSGNLQNVLSVDALSVETAEVIFGPGSLIYGSDAIGGVMDFHTMEPRLSSDKKTFFRGSALARYSTANDENTLHADFNVGGKRFSWLTSITYSDFSDLKMGRNGGQAGYLRPEYVERINDADVIVQNPDPRVQKFTGYNQLNILQKIRYKASDDLDLQYGFTYAGTGDVPRYDRLIQYRDGALRFAEWNYGPMLWRMHNLQVLFTKNNSLFDDARAVISYQDYEESRIDRARGNNNRTKQTEMVDAVTVNIDAAKKFAKGELFYGLEFVHNLVHSTGIRHNIATGVITPFNSRYPDGSTWNTAGIYGSYKLNFSPKFTFTGGLRYSYNTLNADFDTTFIKFPYNDAEIKDGALTGNLGGVFRPDESWQINGSIATGYRMPNIDDIGKLFESVPGIITVPNPNLQPEYAWNFELGFVKRMQEKIRLEATVFHTILGNAIVRRPFTFNGSDSINFDGTLSRVEALQNVAKATVWGLQAGLEYFITDKFSVQTLANWIDGKETDDARNEQVPLRHAAPFYGSTHFRYKGVKLFIEAYTVYNSEISSEDLAPSEQAKTDIYAVDAQGRPFSPGWYTFNLKTAYQLKRLLFTVGWENITNRRYRPYSSGVVAAGTNFIFSARIAF